MLKFVEKEEEGEEAQAKIFILSYITAVTKNKQVENQCRKK